MISRRLMLTLATGSVGIASFTPGFAATPMPFTAQGFADAQKRGRPILVVVHAPWCPTCRTQTPILEQLTADRRFKSLAYFVVDFDRQKDLLQSLGARSQSTLIVFQGSVEKGRSVGDTRQASISALLDRAL